jgi:hypothetical protein
MRQGTSNLEQRICELLPMIQFESEEQKWRFQRAVARASTVEQLPDWCQKLILAAEALVQP